MNGKAALVLASYNSGDMLDQTLEENLKAGFGELIIVDGESTDNTKSVVEKYQRQNPGIIELYETPKRGLADARRFGTSKVKAEYTMHTGPDNIIPKDTLNSLLRLTEKYDLVSCQTELYHVRNYLDKVHNYYKKRYTLGEHDVVGTPYLAKTQLFRDYPYNVKMLNSDDTEFCQRLIDDNKKIYRSGAMCYEIGFNDLPNVIERWMRWGRGDALFYRVMKERWGFLRKLKSFRHPFVAEMITPFRVLPIGQYVFAVPFFMLIMILRYLGWLRYSLFKR